MALRMVREQILCEPGQGDERRVMVAGEVVGETPALGFCWLPPTVGTIRFASNVAAGAWCGFGGMGVSALADRPRPRSPCRC